MIAYNMWFKLDADDTQLFIGCLKCARVTTEADFIITAYPENPVDHPYLNNVAHLYCSNCLHRMFP